ncbi:MAG: 3'-5' exonuclease [Actinomycetaceae bacterium]|nr:3'-5' exonuclease [Actinomycetaceae bacterium]
MTTPQSRGLHATRAYGFLPAWTDLQETPFVAVDFETANRRGGVSACQIALVKYANGQVVESLNTLLKPPPGWDSFEFTYLHGISHSDTLNAPSWVEVVDQITDFVANSPVYAHNAQFDSRVWRQLDEHFDTRTLPSRFFCTYYLARRAISGLENYKLPTVTQACAPDFVLNHHEAGSDAHACAMIVASLQADPSLATRLG